MSANQLALDVVSNNVANLNTPDYSRQVVTMNENTPFTLPGLQSFYPGQLGTGVSVSSITQVRNQYLDSSLWSARGDQSGSNSLQGILTQVQTAVGEPSSSGIGQLMTNFFNSFSDLSANPENGALRSTVLNQAETLTTAFHSVNTAFNQVNAEITSQVGTTVNQVNGLATQIASLNHQIGMSVASGQNPNDLMDQRAALITQLSGLVKVQVIHAVNSTTGQSNGELNLDVGGYALVQQEVSAPLPSKFSSVNGQISLIPPTGPSIPLQGGSLYGLIQGSNLLNGYQSKLDTLAYNLINSVNTLHEAGYGLDGSTGNPFFSTPPPPPGTGAAASISVNPNLINNPSKIAAASPPVPPNPVAPGNGDVANSISQLINTPVIGTNTLAGYYNTLISNIGADTQTAQVSNTNQQQLINQLTNQQQSVSGVNLDEELTKMMQYQRSYQAAARLLTVSDTLITTMITNMGNP